MKEMLDPHRSDSVIYRGNEQGQLSDSVILLVTKTTTNPQVKPILRTLDSKSLVPDSGLLGCTGVTRAGQGELPGGYCSESAEGGGNYE